MSSSRTENPTPSGAPGSLSERVRRRVDRAHAGLARRDALSHGRPRSTPAGPTVTPPSHSVTREERALRVVFRELGKTYRQYRLETGQPISQPLRAAGRAFRQERSFLSLVPVAGFLDDLQLLPW